MKATTVWAWTESYEDWTGDEIPKFMVGICDDDGEPIEDQKIYKCDTPNTAIRVAENIAADRDLEFINDLAY